VAVFWGHSVDYRADILQRFITVSWAWGNTFGHSSNWYNCLFAMENYFNAISDEPCYAFQASKLAVSATQKTKELTQVVNEKVISSSNLWYFICFIRQFFCFCNFLLFLLWYLLCIFSVTLSAFFFLYFYFLFCHFDVVDWLYLVYFCFAYSGFLWVFFVWHLAHLFEFSVFRLCMVSRWKMVKYLTTFHRACRAWLPR